MNPLLNEQLGQATHREYEAKYGRQITLEERDKDHRSFPSWQKLAFAAGSMAALIVLATLFLVS